MAEDIMAVLTDLAVPIADSVAHMADMVDSILRTLEATANLAVYQMLAEYRMDKATETAEAELLTMQVDMDPVSVQDISAADTTQDLVAVTQLDLVTPTQED